MPTKINNLFVEYYKIYKILFIFFPNNDSHKNIMYRLRLLGESELHRPQQRDWVWIVHVVRKGEEWLTAGWVCRGGPRRVCGPVLVVKYGNPNNSLRRGVAQVSRLQLRGQLPFPLIPPVLEPDLHLSLRQVQGGGQAGPLRAAQVALDVEGGLELENLAPGEHRARLLLPAGLSLRVQLVGLSPPVILLIGLFLGLFRVAFLQRDVVVGALLFGVRVTFLGIRGAPVRCWWAFTHTGLITDWKKGRSKLIIWSQMLRSNFNCFDRHNYNLSTVIK